MVDNGSGWTHRSVALRREMHRAREEAERAPPNDNLCTPVAAPDPDDDKNAPLLNYDGTPYSPVQW